MVSNGKSIAGGISTHQRMLQQVTQELVTCPQDLDSFGVHLGFSHSVIDRARNNNPNNIEGAALRLACIWWDEVEGSRKHKEDVSIPRILGPFCKNS